MCKKFARMAFTITSTSKNGSCSQSGRGQLPPSVRKMSTLALDMYNSTTYETHCRLKAKDKWSSHCRWESPLVGHHV
jgi:hypothetical protein